MRRPSDRATGEGASRHSIAYGRLAPGGTPTTPTTNSSLFPPSTREAQFDECWSFVGKKQEHCDPDDPANEQKGDWWDHKAYDPEHRLVICVVPGARNAENAEDVVTQFRRRTGGRAMNQITSDEHRPYKEAVLQAYQGGGDDASGLPVRAPHKGGAAVRYAMRRCTRSAGGGGWSRSSSGWSWDGCPVGPGVVGLGREPCGQRLVPGAAAPDRPAPQRAEAAEDVLLLEVLGGARGGDLLHPL